MLPHSLTSVLELSITRCPPVFKEHNPVPDITDICILSVPYGRITTWNCSIFFRPDNLANVIPIMIFFVYWSIVYIEKKKNRPLGDGLRTHCFCLLLILLQPVIMAFDHVLYSNFGSLVTKEELFILLCTQIDHLLRNTADKRRCLVTVQHKFQ